MNSINEILGMTADEFELERFNAYWKWCEKLTANIRDTQKVLAYPPLSRLYNTEIAKREKEFLSRIKNYKNSATVTNKDRKRLYTQCIELVHDTCWPISLINDALNAQPASKELNTSILCVAVRGVKLDRLTLRLN